MSLPAITGLGLHGPAGTLAETWKVLAHGEGRVRELSLASADEAPKMPGCPAAPVDLADVLPDGKLRKYMNDATQMAVLAAGRALADGSLLGNEALCASTALFVATGLIPFDLAEALPALLGELEVSGDADGARGFAPSADVFRRCNPLLPFKMLLNMPLGLVSIVFGLKGDNAVSYPGAQQAAVSLEIARRGIENGRFPRALVGASARQLSLGPMLNAAHTGRVAPSALQADPAQASHSGLALADAAACLLVEDVTEAHRRGARARALLEFVASMPPDTSSFEERAGDLLGGLDAGPPDVLVETGLCSSDEIEVALDALQARWGSSNPAIVSFDGKLGFAGAAAFSSAIALAVHLFDAGGPPPGTLLRSIEARGVPKRLLVLSQDLDGALGAALLLAPGESS